MYFIDRHTITVAVNKMLQAASGHRETQGIVAPLIGAYRINQRGREAIPSANSINDVADFISLRDVKPARTTDAG